MTPLNTSEAQEAQDHSEEPSWSEQGTRASFLRARQEGNERPNSIRPIDDEVPPEQDLVEQISSRCIAGCVARVVAVGKPRDEAEAEVAGAGHAREDGAAGSRLGAELHETAEELWRGEEAGAHGGADACENGDDV